jgi:8-oxo-dGTP diphosphatase
VPDEFRVATPRVAAGVLFKDHLGRVLLVKPTYKDGWDIPGGYVEPGESPLRAAIRETSEELGLTFAIGRLLLVDWAPHPDEGDKLLFIFDGGKVDVETVGLAALQASEIAETTLAEPDRLADLLPDRLLVRVTSALVESSETYAEHGVRVNRTS